MLEKKKNRVPQHATKQKVFLVLECRMGETRVLKVHATFFGAASHVARLQLRDEKAVNFDETLITYHVIEKSVASTSVVLNTEDTALIHIYK